ncbi:hypothetical protein JOD43_003904 [Pullulanibacillus pueri]|uniref:Uncharacterized protein n=1 Tax=Pullulanibacillus pueri TaxID=1437324 RepID=A0A8J3EMM4_9BACL|nr:hypothetical protein [Pullulanibacillus pueri]MBM7683724.1 hypothetical protein [Pullulanibacillus pueri]GGH85156.1 hypothetical protein GCM10007096_29890 [Pullulanibacillus pueri]
MSGFEQLQAINAKYFDGVGREFDATVNETNMREKCEWAKAQLEEGIEKMKALELTEIERADLPHLLRAFRAARDAFQAHIKGRHIKAVRKMEQAKKHALAYQENLTARIKSDL